MSRGSSKIKRADIGLDRKYSSYLVQKVINCIMKNGKKTVAEKIVFEAIETAATSVKAEPMDLFDTALRNVGPIVEVKSKRIGGANYQIPVEVNKDRKNTLAIRWLIDAAQKSRGQKMSMRLAKELTDAYNNTGTAIKKKEDTHKMAEANKAFAHFARF